MSHLSIGRTSSYGLRTPRHMAVKGHCCMAKVGSRGSVGIQLTMSICGPAHGRDDVFLGRHRPACISWRVLTISPWCQERARTGGIGLTAMPGPFLGDSYRGKARGRLYEIRFVAAPDSECEVVRSRLRDLVYSSFVCSGSARSTA